MHHNTISAVFVLRRPRHHVVNVCVNITSETGLLSACSRHHRQRHTLSHWVALSHTSTRRDRIGAQRPPQTPTTARRSRAVRPNSCVLCQCSPAPILPSTSAAAAAATTRSVGLFGVRACVCVFCKFVCDCATVCVCVLLASCRVAPTESESGVAKTTKHITQKRVGRRKFKVKHTHTHKRCFYAEKTCVREYR